MINKIMPISKKSSKKTAVGSISRVASVVDGACGCEAGTRGVGPVAHGGGVGGAWMEALAIRRRRAMRSNYGDWVRKKKKKKDILVNLWLSTREVVLTSGL